MKEKEKRIIQLDDLKSGIWSGTYVVSVTSFDGRRIKEYCFEEKEDADAAYWKLEKEWKQAAHVSRSAVFVY